MKFVKKREVNVIKHAISKYLTCNIEILHVSWMKEKKIIVLFPQFTITIFWNARLRKQVPPIFRTRYKVFCKKFNINITNLLLKYLNSETALFNFEIFN